MRCRAVLSSCSCSSRSASPRTPEKPSPPSRFLSRVSLCISAYPFSRVFAHPLSRNPRRSLIPNRCRVTALVRELKATITAYGVPRRAGATRRDGVCVHQMSCKKFSLGAKDALHAPCFRVYSNERDTNEDTVPLNHLAGRAREEREENEDTFLPQSRRRSAGSN